MRVVETAIEMLGDGGVDTLSMRALSTQAGVSVPTIYNLIGGRDDVWLRINPVDSGEALADLQAVMPAAPSGIVLPKARNADDAARLATKLDELEGRYDVAAGTTRILPICTERPRALFSLDSYVGATPRLAGGRPPQVVSV